MDTMTDFCKQKDVTNDISEFLIGGASKVRYKNNFCLKCKLL